MVQVLESGLVVPSEETPRYRLWLSNLDLIPVRSHTPTIYFYRSNGESDFFSAEILKSALANALVSFYPFAGRLSADSDGRIEINCNGEGALFVVARSDYTVDNFMNFEPGLDTRKLFVPYVESADPPCILLLLQVTYLRCGGVALGAAMHHAVNDGPSAFHFIQTWSSIARGDKNPPPPPFLDRTLLRAHSPPSILHSHPDYSPNAFSRAPTPCVSHTFKLSKNQIVSLKKRCNVDGCSPFSTFLAVAAHVWKCACAAQGLAPDTKARLLFSTDVRDRLRPPLPKHYFGNAMVRDTSIAKVSDILSNSVGFVAEKIKAATDQVDDGLVRSVIDYLETLDKVSLSSRGGMSESDLRIVSWLEMPMYDANFGWGYPDFMARAQIFGNRVVYLTSNPGNDEGVTVVIALEEKCMETFVKLFNEGL